VILEIDWQGAQQIREVYQQSRQALRSVFILPPSLIELESRLRSRRQDSEAVIQRRLAAAADEISHADEFDYVIINQDFSVALQELEQFVQRSWPAPTSR
jgi:guanylate kinase